MGQKGLEMKILFWTSAASAILSFAGLGYSMWLEGADRYIVVFVFSFALYFSALTLGKATERLNNLSRDKNLE